jgi:hypothetical protein
MIDKTGGVDKALGVHFNPTYKISGANPEGRSTRRDAVTISKFSSMVERGRTVAMALPDVRADRVSQVRSALSGGGPSTGSGGWTTGDIASAMINGAAEGQV